MRNILQSRRTVSQNKALSRPNDNDVSAITPLLGRLRDWGPPGIQSRRGKDSSQATISRKTLRFGGLSPKPESQLRYSGAE